MTETLTKTNKSGIAGQSLRTKNSAAWRALVEFEKAVGGREQLAEVVALAPKSVPQARVLALLMDSARQTDSLATICADAGIPANELLLLFREGNFARAYAQAHRVIADRLPGVVEDVAEKAEDAIVPCECRLTKEGFTAPAQAECKACGGKGVRFRKSSLQHQQLLLEAAEMLKRGVGVSVQVQQNVGIVAGEGFFEKMVRATDDPAYDVEVSGGEEKREGSAASTVREGEIAV